MLEEIVHMVIMVYMIKDYKGIKAFETSIDALIIVA